jgi:serine/threonine-protein kinase
MSDPAEILMRRAEGRLGTTLKGKYRLERLLGIGGMSAVYLAVHRNGNRVALKMLHLELSLDSDVRSRFLQEGYAANNVDHPGVVRVLDDDTTEDGSTFVVMELLDGETLGEKAERSGGFLHHTIVMDAAHQLLDVLAAAEDKGVVHRDIKPHNLFVMADGTVKLLDFGLARMMDAPAGAHATMSGRVFGTPAFMPPEQALGRTAEIDHRSDLWAVGATMFTLLTGRFVHEAESTTEHLVYAASRAARPLASVAPGVPPAVAAIVDKALRFSRGERWTSARAMQRAVEEVFTTVYRAPPPARRGARISRNEAIEGRDSGRASVAPPSAAVRTIPLAHALGGGPNAAAAGVGTAGAAAGPDSWGEPLAGTGRRRSRALWAAAIGGVGLLIALGVALGRGDDKPAAGAAPEASATTVAGASTSAAAASTGVIEDRAAQEAATSAPKASAGQAPRATGGATGAAGTGQSAPSKRRTPSQKPSGTPGAFDYQ